MDDTFLLFKEKEHASLFLNFINSFHVNIKFTMDVEANNELSFLDVLVSRCNGHFLTGVFRKKTFTGLGMNFFSNCSFSFKLNACKTLLFRAYSLSSNWFKFHEEMSFLKSYFSKNCYPYHIFDNLINWFLDNIFRPKPVLCNVPRKQMYVSLPYVPDASFLKRQLTEFLGNMYPYVKFHFIFKNPLTIGSLFTFKDTLPELMRSYTVYLFSCPNCQLGNYVGYSNRLVKVRIDSHRGVSYRTGCDLAKKEFSAIRNHSLTCKHTIKYSDFKILSQSQNSYSLPFLESLYIKQLSPNLNNSTSSVPLHYSITINLMYLSNCLFNHNPIFSLPCSTFYSSVFVLSYLRSVSSCFP